VHRIFFYNADVIVHKGHDLIGFSQVDTKVVRDSLLCQVLPDTSWISSYKLYNHLWKSATESENENETKDETAVAAEPKQVTQMEGDVFPSPTHAIFRNRAPKGSGPVPEGVIVRSLNIAPMANRTIVAMGSDGKTSPQDVGFQWCGTAHVACSCFGGMGCHYTTAITKRQCG
jgi:hypothetical protein